MRQLFPTRGESPREIVAASLFGLAARYSLESFRAHWAAGEFAADADANILLRVSNQLTDVAEACAELGLRTRRGGAELAAVGAGTPPPVPQSPAEVAPPARRFPALDVEGGAESAETPAAPAEESPAEVATVAELMDEFPTDRLPPLDAVELAEGEAPPADAEDGGAVEGGEGPDFYAGRPNHEWPAWDVFGVDPGWADYLARVKARSATEAVEFGTLLFGDRCKSADRAHGDGDIAVIASGGFSGHGPGRSILAAVIKPTLLLIEPESLRESRALAAKLAPSPEPEADRPSVAPEPPPAVEEEKPKRTRKPRARKVADPAWDVLGPVYGSLPPLFLARIWCETAEEARADWGTLNRADAAFKPDGFTVALASKGYDLAVADRGGEQLRRFEGRTIRIATNFNWPPVKYYFDHQRDPEPTEQVELEPDDAPGLLAPDLEAQLAAESDADADDLPELMPLAAAAEPEPPAEEPFLNTYDVLLPYREGGGSSWIGEVLAPDWIEAVNRAAEEWRGGRFAGIVLKVRPGRGVVPAPGGPRFAVEVRECVADGARWDATDGPDCPKCGKPAVDYLDATVPAVGAPADDEDLPELAEVAAAVETVDAILDAEKEPPAEVRPRAGRQPKRHRYEVFAVRPSNGADDYVDELYAANWLDAKMAAPDECGMTLPPGTILRVRPAASDQPGRGFVETRECPIDGERWAEEEHGDFCPTCKKPAPHYLMIGVDGPAEPTAVEETPEEAAAQAATIEAFREAAAAPPAEPETVPGVWAVIAHDTVGRSKGDASFYLEAPTIEEARKVTIAHPLVGDYTVAPMPAEEWGRRGDTFREWGRYPTNQPQPKRDRPAKAEAGGPDLFAPKPPEPRKKTTFHYVARGIEDGKNLALTDAVDASAARVAFERAKLERPAHLWQTKNILAAEYLCAVEDGVPVLGQLPKPAEPDPAPTPPPAAAEPPAPPAVDAPADVLTIFDAVVWCNGREDLISHVSAADAVKAREAVVAKLARATHLMPGGRPAAVESPRWLAVWPNREGVDDVTAKQYHARPRADFCDTPALKATLTGPTHWIKGRWLDVLYRDGDDSGRVAHLGRLNAQSEEMAAALAGLAFSELVDAGAIYAVPASSDRDRTIGGVLERLELPGGVVGFGWLRDLPRPAPAVAPEEAWAEESPAAEAEPEPVPSAPVAPPVEGTPAAADADGDDEEGDDEAPTDTDGLLRLALLNPGGSLSMDPVIRWNMLRQGGASDDELKATLGRVWSGMMVPRLGAEVPGGIIDNGGESCCCYLGGKAPMFWARRTNFGGGATLKGAELLTNVRRILAIPNEGGQLPEPKGKPGRRKKATAAAE